MSSVELTHEEVSEILADIVLADHLGDAYGAVKPILDKCGLSWTDMEDCRSLWKAGYLPAYLAKDYENEATEEPT